MKHIIYTLIFPIILLVVTGCDKEIDDFINEPTDDSIIISGTIQSNDGIAFANIPVSVDCIMTDYFGTTVTHKAKGITDKTGKYRIFFDFTENVYDARISYHLYIDLSSLPSDKYLIPFSDAKYASLIYLNIIEDRSLSCNLTIPRRKNVKIQVNNNGNQLEDGEYSIRNICVYGTSDIQYQHILKSIEIYQYNPINLTTDGISSISIPTAIGINNNIQLVYRGKEDGTSYGIGLPSSNVQDITISESFDNNITLDYTPPQIPYLP